MTRDAHARTSGEGPEPLYDINVATPSHAERARTMVAQIPTGTLGSIGLDPAGFPYTSFITVGFDAGQPVFLISELAEQFGTSEVMCVFRYGGMGHAEAMRNMGLFAEQVLPVVQQLAPEPMKLAAL